MSIPLFCCTLPRASTLISSYFLLLLFFFFVSILISLFLSRPRVVPISRILPFFPYLDDRPLRHPSPFTLQHAARQVSAARTLHTCVLSVIPLFLLLLQFCKLQFLQLTLFVRLFFAIALFALFFLVLLTAGAHTPVLLCPVLLYIVLCAAVLYTCTMLRHCICCLLPPPQFIPQRESCTPGCR